MSLRPPLFLALDAGTTSFKAILFDADGRLMGHERAEIRMRHPHLLAAEVDADDWWRAAVSRVPRLLALAGVTPEAIAAIGVTGAMHALVPVAADGSVLAPTLTWFDQRCRPQAEALRSRSEGAFAAVGGVSVYASSARLRWLREVRPDVVDRAHRFLLPKDYLRFRLTGRFATDPSDARGTSMVDRASGDWHRELVEQVLEVPARKLPEILPATQLAGTVTAEAAAALGLRIGTAVAVGMADTASTLLGVNAFQPGRLCIYLGTGTWMARLLPPDNGEEPRTVWMGNTLACGSALLWARRLLCPAEEAPDYEALEQGLRSVPPGADGLIFLPHLMGERGRCSDPDARGCFFGLTFAHTPAHLLRAVVEGVVFQIRREMDTAAAGRHEGASPGEKPWSSPPDEPVLLSGAAARSAVWQQVVADTTDRPVIVPEVPDATALGAAMIAAVAVGHFPSPRAASAAWFRPGVVLHPSEQGSDRYAAAYERYLALETALAPLFHPWSSNVTTPGARTPEHLNT
jgi:xylulokinase